MKNVSKIFISFLVGIFISLNVGVYAARVAPSFFNQDSTSIVTQDVDWNYAIGTTTATTKFNVVGTSTMSNIIPYSDSTYTLGLTGTRWKTAYIDALHTETVTVDGTSAGDMNMSNNLILNIGTSTTDFTASGGLNLAGSLAVTGTSAFTGNASFGTIATGTWNGTAIATQYGGTGSNWASVATGSIPYFSGTGALSTLADATSSWVLMAQGSGVVPAWSLIASSSIVSDTLDWDKFSDAMTIDATTTIALSNTLNIDSGTLFIDGANDQIGIGTSTVSGDLQVIDNASSTIYLGDATHSGCIVMGDSDSGGVTYVTALDGTLSATTTKPAVCK